MGAKNQFKPTEPQRSQGESPRAERDEPRPKAHEWTTATPGMPNPSTAEKQTASTEIAGPKNTETLHALHAIHCKVDYATEDSTVTKPIISAIIDQKETNNSHNLQPSLVEPTKKHTPITIIPPSTTLTPEPMNHDNLENKPLMHPTKTETAKTTKAHKTTWTRLT